MAIYRKVPTDLKFVEREKEVEEFWNREHIFEKSIEDRKGGDTYMFYDGPPTANGKPHIGHVLTRTVWSPSSRSARRAYGDIRACGRISPRPSASGRIWTIPT